MSYKTEYKKWLNESRLNVNLKKEMTEVMNEEEIEDRFYKKLNFGTAGIRGVLGAGTNRMNVHTVAEVTEGLAKKIKADQGEAQGVVIGYDVRHMSKEFAELAASILSNHGITVHLFDDIVPTPLLSYAIRELKAISGIMITASHNPKEYNGYKVYWKDGAQIQESTAKEIVKYVSSVKDMFAIEGMNIDEARDLGLVKSVSSNLIEKYKKKVLNLSVNDDVNKDISIVYSPLNGTGNALVREILEARGFNNLHIVEEQENPDPNFTTVKYPNPEEIEVFDYAIKKGLQHNSDILITTDPDADRVGVMIKHNGKYEYMSGNDIGTVMTYYMLSSLYSQGKLNKKPKVVKTIVTDNLVDKIAETFEVEVFDVHVGFKNIYYLVKQWEEQKDYGYILGYEESLGFGIGSDLARDKDAVSAAMIIVEMAAYYNKEGRTLIHVLNEIQQQYGFHSEHLESITMPGKNGKEEMDLLIKNLRINPMKELNGSKLVEKIDYLNDDTDLEKTDVIKYIYEDGTWFVVRPSGTEPKLKVYIYTVGDSKEESNSKMKDSIEVIKNKLSL